MIIVHGVNIYNYVFIYVYIYSMFKYMLRVTLTVPASYAKVSNARGGLSVCKGNPFLHLRSTRSALEAPRFL